jgi:hypothetical protein
MEKPKRNYELIITVSSNNKEDLFNTLKNCYNTVTSELDCSSCGGQWDYIEYNAKFYKNDEMTKEKYNIEREKFSKEIINHSENYYFCKKCGNWNEIEKQIKL